MITLRPYQTEALASIPQSGRHIIALATGLGKTVLFSQIPRKGRVLILSHREELVNQPVKYYNCKVGIERASETANGEEVVSASVQSIVRRLDKYKEDDFDIVIVDECQHSPSPTYMKICDYFKPRLLLGFTATPKRGDGVRLDKVFDSICYHKDIRWGIENNWLSDIYCRQVEIGYNLQNVKTAMGDYAESELADAMEGTGAAIGDAYTKYAKGSTLIFGVSVAHCQEIAASIPGAMVVTGETKNRAEIIERFTRREISCIVNCMIFTEGTDLPLVETVIVARPTKNVSLYTQIVGRGLRLHPDKPYLNLIDCVGASCMDMCRAPSLLGLDPETVPKEKANKPLRELEEIALQEINSPIGWIRNIKTVSLWAKKERFDLHGVNYFREPNGDLVLRLPKSPEIRIPAPTVLGKTFRNNGEIIEMQTALDRVYQWLCNNAMESKTLWNLAAVKRWGKEPASEKQLGLLNRMKVNWKEAVSEISKLDAACMINGKFSMKGNK
jgi:type I site-specific restriction endonuclease